MPRDFDYGPKIPAFAFTDYPRLAAICLRNQIDLAGESRRFEDCRQVAEAIESGTLQFITAERMAALEAVAEAAQTLLGIVYHGYCKSSDEILAKEKYESALARLAATAGAT